MSVEEFSKRIEIFQKGFEAITSNISNQLTKVDKEVEKLVKNTDSIPKIKEDNKTMYKTLSGLSAMLIDLIRRLDKYENL